MTPEKFKLLVQEHLDSADPEITAAVNAVVGELADKVLEATLPPGRAFPDPSSRAVLEALAPLVAEMAQCRVAIVYLTAALRRK